MTAAPELTDWTASFARRTRTLGGGEITAILALAGATDVITFSGGFPDPATFPRDVLGEIAGRLVAQTEESWRSAQGSVWREYSVPLPFTKMMRCGPHGRAWRRGASSSPKQTSC
jgi:hypothetical protein